MSTEIELESIVVSDANIFMDLCTVDLLNEFFSLPWTIHTTDMILSEIREESTFRRSVLAEVWL